MSKFKDNIPGFPGYHVTKNGDVYSMKCKSGKRPEAFKLKPRLNGNGYYRIGLYKDGIKYERRLNRLVAMVYIPNPDNLPCVCHKDNNPLNNNVDNLYWGSVEDNIRDREGRYEIGDITRYKLRTGLHKSMVKICVKYLRDLVSIFRCKLGYHGWVAVHWTEFKQRPRRAIFSKKGGRRKAQYYEKRHVEYYCNICGKKKIYENNKPV